MEVVTNGYAVRSSDQILLHTVRATPDKVLEEFGTILADPSSVITEVAVKDVEDVHSFSPNKFAFQGFSPEGEMSYFIGDLHFEEDGSSVIGEVRYLSPTCSLVQKMLSNASLETVYLMETIGSDAGNLYVHKSKAFVVTENGDTTSILQILKKGELNQVIDTLLQLFFEVGVE